MDYRLDSPKLLLDFLSYHETIKAHSQRTVDEYYLDMRNFFRYMKQFISVVLLFRQSQLQVQLGHGLRPQEQCIP